MNLLGAKNSDFDFRLPRTFIPQKVVDKYKPYLNKKPGVLLKEPIDYVNYAIQGLNVQGGNFDPVSQNDNDGTTRYYRSTDPMQNIVERTFTVDMQYLDGFINYFIMYDTFFYYYSKQTDKKHTDDLNLQLYDREGAGTVYFRFREPIYNSISELNLNFSKNIVDFESFQITFHYNEMDLKIEID